MNRGGGGAILINRRWFLGHGVPSQSSICWQPTLRTGGTGGAHIIAVEHTTLARVESLRTECSRQVCVLGGITSSYMAAYIPGITMYIEKAHDCEATQGYSSHSCKP